MHLKRCKPKVHLLQYGTHYRELQCPRVSITRVLLISIMNFSAHYNTKQPESENRDSHFIKPETVHFKMHYLFFLPNLFFSYNRFIVGNKNKQGHSCKMFRNPLREASKFLVYNLCFARSYMTQLTEAFCHNIIKVVSLKVPITVQS